MYGGVGREKFLSLKLWVGAVQYKVLCGFSWVVTVAAIGLVLWINSVKVLVCSCMLRSKLKD